MITDDDRRAAVDYLSPARERTVDGLIQAFAAHREATEVAIVAWLRSDDGPVPGYTLDLHDAADIADAIAAGAHRG